MSQVFDQQLNLICVGDTLTGKSSFLEQYAHSSPQELHYRVYPFIYGQKKIVYLHEVEQRYGMEAYLTYPFDGVLYFLDINEFHNPHWGILDQLSQISKLNGGNIFKIPIKLVVLSSKKQPYYNINEKDKLNFIRQLDGMIEQSMIIFVEDENEYAEQLTQFYRSILADQAPGISEGLYVNWQLKGVVGLIPFDNFMLNMKKVVELWQRNWIKMALKWKQKAV